MFFFQSFPLFHIIPLIICGAILAMVLLTLTALMFRNVNLIFKTTNQESPFAAVNVKRVQQIGYIAIVNLSKIKNNKVNAIRFSTLAGICKALECEPGDILKYDPSAEAVDEEM